MSRIRLTTQPPPRVDPGAILEELAPAPEQYLEVLLLLKARASSDEIADAVEAMANQLPGERRYVTPGDDYVGCTADREARAKLESFAESYELDVVEYSRNLLIAVLVGTVRAFERAFEVELHGVRIDDRTHRVPIDGFSIPAELEDVVEGVFGLDDLPLDVPPERADADVELESAEVSPPVDPKQVAARYQFPRGADGSGFRIGLILMNGGFYESDIREYFRSQDMADHPLPRVVEIGNATNSPMARDKMRALLEKPNPDDPEWIDFLWSVEATVDVELTSGFAPGAELTVYFTEDTEKGKIHALTRALRDDIDVLSGSWGRRESELDAHFKSGFDRVLQLLALRGVSVCYSSGDKGAAQLRFPASSPHVLGCGGTWLEIDTGDAEVVWNESSAANNPFASGGGFSTFFPRPSWQTNEAGVAWRGVPDVAGKANFQGGYKTFIAGKEVQMGGTSSAAPMWAALLACLNQELGRRVGWISPLLYWDSLRGALTDITKGDNGPVDAPRGAPRYEAHPGWDACTGLGTPIGAELLKALRG